MDTIRNTGPGLITRILYEYLCKDAYNNNDSNINNDCRINGTSSNNSNNDNDNNNDIKNNDILILPYKSFNPVPNTVITDLSDKNQIQFVKNKYLNECNNDNDDIYNNENNNIDNNNNDINDDNDGNSNNDNNNTNNKNNKKNKNNERINEKKNTVHSYAIHWWQRSWQS
jgi:hypothetical protein